MSKENPRDRLEKLLAAHSNEHTTISCTDCPAQFHPRQLRTMDVCDDVDALLDDEGRALKYRVATAADKKRRLHCGLRMDTPVQRINEILKGFDDATRETESALEEARYEARVGHVVFDEIYPHTVYCPECGEGKLELATERCVLCDELRPKADMTPVDLYGSPFDEAPEECWVCLVEDPDNGGLTCFDRLVQDGYFECEDCNRTVRTMHSNNMHSHVHVVTDDRGDVVGQICLRCYEKQLLREGVPNHELDNGKISGMFFSEDNHELSDAGFEHVGDKFVKGAESAQRVCDKALGLKAQGYIVVFAYESLGICGSEGHISVWKKLHETDAVANGG